MSSDDFPKEMLSKIKARALQNTAEAVEAKICEDGIDQCDSPIEKILFIALNAEIDHGFYSHKYIHCSMRGQIIQDPKSIERHTEFWQSVASDFTLIVQPQAQLENWRVDFLITTTNVFTGKSKHLIVECDGHEFHERTKKQAARDRSRDRNFQSKGYTVYRFTGSEIWKDPCDCAEQIANWADEAKYSDKPESPINIGSF
jgi:very-short-patch-repair endonuclease